MLGSSESESSNIRTLVSNVNVAQCRTSPTRHAVPLFGTISSFSSLDKCDLWICRLRWQGDCGQPAGCGPDVPGREVLLHRCLQCFGIDWLLSLWVYEHTHNTMPLCPNKFGACMQWLWVPKLTLEIIHQTRRQWCKPFPLYAIARAEFPTYSKPIQESANLANQVLYHVLQHIFNVTVAYLCCSRRLVLDLLSAFVFDPFADVQKM